MTIRFASLAARLLLAVAATAWAASPAPATAATLGDSTVGSATDTGDSNYMNGSRFTMPATGGTVSSMSVYVSSVAAAPGNKYQLAIYTDSAGQPAMLLAASGTGTLTANAWNTLATATSLRANTPYWLMYNTKPPCSAAGPRPSVHRWRGGRWHRRFW